MTLGRIDRKGIHAEADPIRRKRRKERVVAKIEHLAMRRGNL